MKKMFFFIVGGIVLIVSIFLLSFYSWSYFNTRKPKTDLNTLEIILSDDGNVNLTDQAPVSDNEGEKITPYTFKVINKSNVSSKYQLLIEDYVSDDTKELLSRRYLKYELKQNNSVIKSGLLSEISNNIIDEDTILEKEQKNYELRIWVDEKVNTSEWIGKSYNYNVKVNPVLE